MYSPEIKTEYKLSAYKAIEKLTQIIKESRIS